MSIEIEITKKLSNFTLNISLSTGNIRAGLLGASGCGKSMTLKCIAGIETPDKGRIVINGRTVFDSEKHINIKPQERKCGFLFQNYALFPTMTVRENIEQVLYRLPADERIKKTDEMLNRFGIKNLADQKPQRLSGGQQQRAALARMMVLQPEIIMLDEPFSALDSFLKQQVETNVMQLLSDFKGTLLFVSHNRDEVFRICKEMFIISNGNISRSGKCTDIFLNPQTVEAAKLSGCKNIAPFTKINENTIFVPSWNLKLHTASSVSDKATHVGIRAHFIRPPKSGENENCFDFTVKEYRNSPFSVSQYISVIGAAAFLDREISSDSSTIIRKDSEDKNIRLCIPAQELMLLS